jgi:hypothetical protein
MIPIPEKMIKIVKILPDSETVLTSRKPTVVMVITVIYRDSKKFHLSMRIYPMVPINNMSTRMVIALITILKLKGKILLSALGIKVLRKRRKGLVAPFSVSFLVGLWGDYSPREIYAPGET